MAPTDNTPTMQKYLFKGHAIALKGSVRKPYYQELGNHLEIATYAGSGGNLSATNRGFALVNNDISYESASTHISAGEVSPGIFECTVKSQVKNLRIGNILHVEEVTSQLRSVYDARSYPKRTIARISPAGSDIKNLVFGGEAQKIIMPTAFRTNSKAETEFFAGTRDEELEFQPSNPPKAIYKENFGTVYYAEWVWVHPQEKHRQHITMLRLALGSDYGGGIDVGICDNDGSGWPPLPN